MEISHQVKSSFVGVESALGQMSKKQTANRTVKEVSHYQWPYFEDLFVA